MIKHIAILPIVAAVLAPLPGWTAPITLVSRELDVLAEAAFSFGTPLVNAQNAVAAGAAPLTVEAFIAVGSNVDTPFRGRGFISAQGSAAGLGVGANTVFGAGTGQANPPNVYTARAFETQTVANTSSSTFSVVGDFEIPAPTVTVLEFGNALAPPDPKLPRATAFFELTTALTRADGITVRALPFLYGVETFRSSRTADLLPIVIGSASGIEVSTGPNGQLTFAVPALTLADFSLGSLAPGEVLKVTGRYFAQIGSGFGETGASAFIGDPNNLSASSARFTLETGNGAGSVDPLPGPTPVPAPAGWALLAIGLAALGATRGEHFWSRHTD